MSIRTTLPWLILSLAASSPGQIPQPADAPQPLLPEESARRIKLPPGFRIELVASEPLVREPSGVCWDERGRLFVCELHGYNLEGQYDIEELNKTGQLDREVRRIQADDRAKTAAKAGTNGTVKRLIDIDADGRMDRAEVWADRLPPCYGICPARGGIIVACAPDIVFLADRNGDGKAEVREMLFTGFATGALERGINCPQWGPDDWIYVGRGHGGGRITGPKLKLPVELPNTDFRLRADGSAIEPVGGATHTFGFTFTETADRFVISTRTPGILVAPLPWRYLARNPDVAAPGLEHDASPDQRVYPISQPHPWRTKRAGDPGFSKFYSDRYGLEESAPNGYFTSACSPLVYQDAALPGLRGHLLACEPAQNLVHRAIVQRNGPRLALQRAASEQQSEFLASSDPWFHPMALSHGPDGAVWIVDFYREIIEDYSAIPRYLQQQYGLIHGNDHGRLWRIVHDNMPTAPSPDMARLSSDPLAHETVSPYYWRRQTARRLLVERTDQSAAQTLARIALDATDPAAAINALYTMAALAALAEPEAHKDRCPDGQSVPNARHASLDSNLLLAAMAHPAPAVRVHGLRLADPFFADRPLLLDKALSLADDTDPTVQLQLALSLGESRDPRVTATLARLAREHGDVAWMNDAILSSVSGQAGELLEELLQATREGKAPVPLAQARGLLGPLCGAIGARRHPGELSEAIVCIAAVGDRTARLDCLRGLRGAFQNTVSMALTDAARQALKSLAASPDEELRSTAQSLVTLLKLETMAQREARLAVASRDLADVKLPVENRLAAVAQLAAENDASVTATLLAALSDSTPQLRDAILNAAFARRDRLPAVIEALEKKTIPASALSAVQSLALLEHPSDEVRQRAHELFEPTVPATEDAMARFAAALESFRDVGHGAQVFREKCANCHAAHDVGFSVGPDLTAEFQRAETTIVRDILAPNETIASGYVTFVIETTEGQIVSGLIASESAGGVTLRQPGGKEKTVLRKDIEILKATPVSIMPEDLARTLTPQDMADVIAWLRSPPARLVLFDENPALAMALNQGDGSATFVLTDKLSGQASLRITPPQRFSPRIPGWSYLIRERPGPGEFRYLRFAWKSDGAQGVMIELANEGRWPPAQAARFRYYAGRNSTGWQAIELDPQVPAKWTVVTRDLWKDFGDSTITGIAPTAMEGPALFDRLELLRAL